jgi:hypothetical protein
MVIPRTKEPGCQEKAGLYAWGSIPRLVKTPNPLKADCEEAVQPASAGLRSAACELIRRRKRAGYSAESIAKG